MAKKKSDTREREDAVPRHWKMLWVVGAGLWCLLAAALISHDVADFPSHVVAVHNQPSHNWVGDVGALLSHKIYLMLGPGAWVVMAGLAAGLLTLSARRPVTQPVMRLIGLLIIALVTSSLVALTAPGGLPLFSVDGGRPEGSGGLAALFVTDQLTMRFNVPGTFVILLVILFVGALLAVDELFVRLPVFFGRLLKRVREFPVPRVDISSLRPRLVLSGGRGAVQARVCDPGSP